MKTITPTEFRKNLFNVVSGVLHGDDVIVHTRQGDVVMKRVQKDKHACSKPLAPKLPGAVKKPLGDQADRELRKYARWTGR